MYMFWFFLSQYSPPSFLSEGYPEFKPPSELRQQLTQMQSEADRRVCGGQIKGVLISISSLWIRNNNKSKISKTVRWMARRCLRRGAGLRAGRDVTYHHARLKMKDLKQSPCSLVRDHCNYQLHWLAVTEIVLSLHTWSGGVTTGGNFLLPPPQVGNINHSNNLCTQSLPFFLLLSCRHRLCTVPPSLSPTHKHNSTVNESCWSSLFYPSLTLSLTHSSLFSSRQLSLPPRHSPTSSRN